MKRIFLFAIFLTMILACTASQQTGSQTGPAAVELSFSFIRKSGSASNQYAVWIENAQGQHIKTVYATRWTANGGYSRRPTSIPIWVRQSGLSNMSREQVDAVSGATPRTGNLTYSWDGTDSRGTPVPAGDYVLILEGTLRWENQVLYRAPFRLGQGPSSVNVSVDYTGDPGSDRDMIGNVTVRTLR